MIKGRALVFDRNMESKTKFGKDDDINLRLMRVACWTGREQSPGGKPMFGQNSQAGLI